MQLKMFLKHLFLKYSTCLTIHLYSELKSKRKQDQTLSLMSSHHCTYFTKQGMEETVIRWSETLRLGMWREKELSPHTSISHSYFGGKRTRHFSAGWAGAEDGCCSSCRDTDSVGWIHETAKCHDTGAVQPCWRHTEPAGSFPPLTYARKSGLVHMPRKQLPLRCTATSHRWGRRDTSS